MSYAFSVHISCGQIVRQDETTRLAEAAIKIITGQVKVPGNSMTLLQDPMKMNCHGTIETINGMMMGEMYWSVS